MATSDFLQQDKLIWKDCIGKYKTHNKYKVEPHAPLNRKKKKHNKKSSKMLKRIEYKETLLFKRT